MTKTLRKYQKWILVVGGSLLMVTFLVSGPMRGFGKDPSGRTYATLGGKDVTAGDYDMSRSHFDVLREAARPAMALLGIENSDHWFLLVHEAKAGGFVGHAGDGRDFIPELAEMCVEVIEQGDMRTRFELMQKPELRKEYVGSFVQRLESAGARDRHSVAYTREGFELALAELRGVYRMLAADNGAVRLSERAARVALAEKFSGATVDAIVLDGEALAAAMPAPTSEQLQQHFEAHRDKKPADSPDGVGYVLPQRVRLEWLSIDRDVIAKAVKLDPVEVRKRYMQNRETFKGEFEAERASVEKAITAELVDRVVGEADRAIRAQVSQALRGVPEDGSFRKLPADWEGKRPRLADLAKRVVEGVQTSVGVAIPEPKTESRDKFLTPDDLTQLPGIGGATLRLGSSTARFMNVPFLARELRTGEAKGEIPGLQVGVPFTAGVLANAAGDRFYFTLLAFKPEGPAESLDEVRERAEKDWRALRAYDRLMGQGEAFKALAVSDSLEAVGKLAYAADPKATPPAVKRRASVTREAGGMFADQDLSAKPVVDAVLAQAEGMDPLSEVKADTLAQRTSVVGLPGKHHVVVVQVLQARPLTVESMRRVSRRVMDQLRASEYEAAFPTRPTNAFTFDQLKARLDFKLVERKDKPQSQQ